MRDALSAALQDFAGAMIIVSHDRHLLRTTADDFYLVDKGMVSEFSGDLDDYHKYLIEQRKQKLSQSASESVSANTEEAMPSFHLKITRKTRLYSRSFGHCAMTLLKR